jgi:hypothetical protein
MTFNQYRALVAKVFPQTGASLFLQTDCTDFYSLVHDLLDKLDTAELDDWMKVDTHSLRHVTEGRLSGSFVWDE